VIELRYRISYRPSQGLRSHLRASSISQVVYIVAGLWYNGTVGTVMAQVGRLGLLSYIQKQRGGQA